MIARLAVNLPLARYWTLDVAVDRLLRHLESSSLSVPV